MRSLEAVEDESVDIANSLKHLSSLLLVMSVCSECIKGINLLHEAFSISSSISSTHQSIKRFPSTF